MEGTGKLRMPKKRNPTTKSCMKNFRKNVKHRKYSSNLSKQK
jgi:hypothetical protein